MERMKVAPPRNRIAQLGYVVHRRDFDACVAFWQETTGIGPFYVGDFLLDDQLYRGRPTTMGMRVALGYLGDMQIELIGQNDDQPSVYREWIDRHDRVPRGGLFHHYFLLTDDYDDVAARLSRQGAECAFTASMPRGGRLSYFDATETLGHYVESSDRFEPWLEMFERLRASAAYWNGERPVRPLEEILGGIEF